MVRQTQMSAWWNQAPTLMLPLSNLAQISQLCRLCFLIYAMTMILFAPPYLCVKWKWHMFIEYLLCVGYYNCVKDPGLNKEDKIGVFIGLRVCMVVVAKWIINECRNHV